MDILLNDADGAKELDDIEDLSLHSPTPLFPDLQMLSPLEVQNVPHSTCLISTGTQTVPEIFYPIRDPHRGRKIYVGLFNWRTCCGRKKWTMEDLLVVYCLEKNFYESSTVSLDFPCELDKATVLNMYYSYFCAAEVSDDHLSCCATLKNPSDRASIILEINNAKYNSNYVSAYRTVEEPIHNLGNIDPFTIFLRNSPPEKSQMLLDMFPECSHILQGCLEYRNYAYIVFPKIVDAIDAFNKINSECDMQPRFRKFQGVSERFGTDVELKNAHPQIIIDISKELEPSLNGNTSKENVISEPKCSVDDEDYDMFCDDYIQNCLEFKALKDELAL